MDKASVPQERLLYASYFPPHYYEDGTDDGQAIVTALFQEPTESGGVGYAIREYSLLKGDMFYRFPNVAAIPTPHTRNRPPRLPRHRAFTLREHQKTGAFP